MDGFLIRLPKNSDANKACVPYKAVLLYESDDAEKMGKPHNLSIRFEGLDRLQILKGLHTV